ncbi:MAG: FAD-binding oxidoreductase, partial [Streptomyces sp.]|nr:FAD-binding oxidoreductase [Streptomyces sp.]
MSADTVPVTGWGRTAPTAARLIRPRSYEEAVAAVRGCGARGGIPRGLGRAYGDAAQNAGGAVFDMTGLNRVHAIDAEGGIVLCDAGVSLHRLMEVLLPLGWFVPVTPGTRYVTVGGAIGADVHGRNHHVSGSFSRHVLSFELLTAEGEIRTVRGGTPLFDATTGGMGLTGMILTATVQLQPVETSLMSVDTERARDLDDLMARLTATDREYRYSAAWVDLLARGAATGRAVLTRGDHAPLEALETPGLLARGTRARRDPLAFGTPRFPAPPPFLPEGLLNRTSVGLFNELRYRRAPRARTGRLQRISAFFHPLDAVPHWNRIYGRGGLVQYQFVVGQDQEDALRRIVRRVSERRCPSLLAVLKR